MSKSIHFICRQGGSLSDTNIAILNCTKNLSDEIKEELNDILETKQNTEWVFDDGSIVALHYAGIYAKEKWYFMAYDCTESDAIRYRRANPTPDTSHE